MSTSISGGGTNVLVVDANVLVSALRRGKAIRVFAQPRLKFFTPVRTTWEAQKYIPGFAEELRQRGIPVPEVELEARLFSLPVIAVSDVAYRDYLADARRLIGARDPDDADVLALLTSA